MTRMTMKYLEARVEYLNKLTDNPLTPWSQNKAGKFRANIGNYHLDGAYGGWQLVQHMNEGGGVTVPLSTGHVSKRELAEKLDAFISGLELGKDRGQQCLY